MFHSKLHKTALFFYAAVLSHFHMNENPRLWTSNTTFPTAKLTVIIIRVDQLLPVTLILPSSLAILVPSARLPIESLLFQDLLLPGRWRRAGVVVETREEVWDLWDGEDGPWAHVNGKVLLHRDFDRRGRGRGDRVGRHRGGGGGRGRGGGGGRGDGQVGGRGWRWGLGDTHVDCQTGLWNKNGEVKRRRTKKKVRKTKIITRKHRQPPLTLSHSTLQGVSGFQRAHWSRIHMEGWVNPSLVGTFKQRSESPEMHSGCTEMQELSDLWDHSDHIRSWSGLFLLALCKEKVYLSARNALSLKAF